MSAALAGVNSITVTPFDKTYKTPDDFSERIARNQQLLLKEECHFNKVVDPAAGSYFIENLTVSIAKQAWDLFLNVEEEGGMLEAVKAGKVQATRPAMMLFPNARKYCSAPTNSLTSTKKQAKRIRSKHNAAAPATVARNLSQH